MIISLNIPLTALYLLIEKATKKTAITEENSFYVYGLYIRMAKKPKSYILRNQMALKLILCLFFASKVSKRNL
jgi:hypothetical protein